MEIKANKEEAKKFKLELSVFDEKMGDYYKSITEIEKQKRLIGLFEQDKNEILEHNKKQNEVLDKIIKDNALEKANLETKNKQLIKHKGCKVIIRQAEITEEKESAIVNPTNADLQHTEGLAGRIASKGGPIIKKESDEYIRNHGKLSIGEAITTDAGDLPCEMVIHVVEPIYPKNSIDDQNEKEELKTAIKSILSEMQKYDMNSVSFPAISTGILSLPSELSATIIGEVLKEAIDNNPEFYNGRKLIICNIDEETTSTMEELIPSLFD